MNKVMTNGGLLACAGVSVSVAAEFNLLRKCDSIGLCECIMCECMYVCMCVVLCVCVCVCACACACACAHLARTLI